MLEKNRMTGRVQAETIDPGGDYARENSVR